MLGVAPGARVHVAARERRGALGEHVADVPAGGEVGEDPVAQRLHVRALLEAHLGRQRDHASWLSAHFPLASDRGSGRTPQVLSFASCFLLCI